MPLSSPLVTSLVTSFLYADVYPLNYEILDNNVHRLSITRNPPSLRSNNHHNCTHHQAATVAAAADADLDVLVYKFMQCPEEEASYLGSFVDSVTGKAVSRSFNPAYYAHNALTYYAITKGPAEGQVAEDTMRHDLYTGQTSGVRFIPALNASFPFIFRRESDGSVTLGFLKPGSEEQPLTFNTDAPFMQFERYYRPVSLATGPHTYAPQLTYSAAAGEKAPRVSVRSLIDDKWVYDYVDGNGDTWACTEIITDALRSRGEQTCVKDDVSQRRRFILQHRKDGAIEFVTSGILPATTETDPGWPSVLWPQGSFNSLRYYMFPASFSRYLTGLWRTSPGFTSCTPFTELDAGGNLVRFRLDTASYYIETVNASKAIITDLITEKSHLATRIDVDYGFKFFIQHCNQGEDECSSEHPAPVPSDDVWELELKRCDDVYMDHMLGSFRDELGRVVTYTAADYKEKRQRTDANVDGSVSIETVDVAAQTITVETTPDPTAASTSTSAVTTTSTMNLRYRITSNGVTYTFQNSEDTRIEAESAAGGARRLRPAPRPETILGGDWWHGEALACLPHARAGPLSVIFRREHRDNVEPVVCNVTVSKSSSLGVMVCDEADGHHDYPFVYYHLRPNNHVYVALGGYYPDFDSWEPDLHIWSRCERSAYSRIRDSTLIGHFQMLTLDGPVADAAQLEYNWGTYVPQALAEQDVPCEEWVGVAGSDYGNEAHYAMKRDPTKEIHLSYKQSIATFANRKFFWEVTPSGFLVMRSLPNGERGLVAQEAVPEPSESRRRSSGSDDPTEAGKTVVLMRCAPNVAGMLAGTRQVVIRSDFGLKVFPSPEVTREYKSAIKIEVPSSVPERRDVYRISFQPNGVAAIGFPRPNHEVPDAIYVQGLYVVLPDGSVHVGFPTLPNGLPDPTSQTIPRGVNGRGMTRIEISPLASPGDYKSLLGSWAPYGSTKPNQCVAYAERMYDPELNQLIRTFTDTATGLPLEDILFLGTARGKRVRKTAAGEGFAWHSMSVSQFAVDGSMTMTINRFDDDVDAGYALGDATLPPAQGIIDTRTYQERLIPCGQVLKVEVQILSPLPEDMNDVAMSRFFVAAAERMELAPEFLFNREYKSETGFATFYLRNGYDVDVTPVRDRFLEEVKQSEDPARIFAGFTINTATLIVKVDDNLHPLPPGPEPDPDPKPDDPKKREDDKARGTQLLIILGSILSFLLVFTVCVMLRLRKPAAPQTGILDETAAHLESDAAYSAVN